MEDDAHMHTLIYPLDDVVDLNYKLVSFYLNLFW